MTEQTWKLLFRNPSSTVSKALRSPAFIASRERAAVIIDDAAALRAVADVVETLDHTSGPLVNIADRVAAAVRFLRMRADLLDTDGAQAGSPMDVAESTAPAAVAAARERLVVAGLHYLITPIDLVPDFRAGGYLDDVLLLTWVFGAATDELGPYLDDEPDD